MRKLNRDKRGNPYFGDLGKNESEFEYKKTLKGFYSPRVKKK